MASWFKSLLVHKGFDVGPSKNQFAANFFYFNSIIFYESPKCGSADSHKNTGFPYIKVILLACGEPVMVDLPGGLSITVADLLFLLAELICRFCTPVTTELGNGSFGGK